MLDYLDKLRAKPVHVRQRIALMATVTLSLLVASIAWSTWNTESAIAPAFTETPTRSPWGVVSDLFVHTKGEMTAAISDATKQLQHATETNVEYAKITETATSTGAIEQTDADEEAAPPSHGTGASSGTIRTRPGSVSNKAAGKVAGDNVVQ